MLSSTFIILLIITSYSDKPLSSRDEYQGKLNYVIALTYCGEVAHNQGLDFNEPVDVGVRERFMLESLRYLHRAQAEFAILDERLREGDITLDQRHKEKFVFLHAKLLLYLGLLALERSSFEEASSNFQVMRRSRP